MNIMKFSWRTFANAVTIACLIAGPAAINAEEDDDAQPVEAALTGPTAAMQFEQSFRDPENGGYWNPIPFDECKNITELTKDLWSKKHVLTHFKKHRTEDQVGVIVFVKTEYCCDDSRLCAVTTACLEKKSTPLVGRFRIYGGWISNHPDHSWEEWNDWDEEVIEHYDFVQGPGARIVVMVPLWNGKMRQWQSTATELELSHWEFENDNGTTPALERFLKKALKHAPPPPDSAANRRGAEDPARADDS